MKKKYTKWIPLGSYSFSNETQYVVFVRRNLKTDMLQFKTKQANPHPLRSVLVKPILNRELINTQEAWDKITSEG